ncbi:MAG: hypothetical protein CFE43_16140 [Burkholderiales bacterium PBB3]|nr:MAG: hypothetical protein CFE43_16140 [Burkholderiales bacterium PBB3]
MRGWQLGAWLTLSASSAWASSLDYCDGGTEPSAAVQDRLLQVAAITKTELEKSGHTVALISRSGLALQRLGQRYSHAGVSLQASPNTPWSVRQLYFACDEQRPRIFDQGISGFVMGANDLTEGYVSIVLLPADAGAALERTALDGRSALALLASTYSANAYAFSQRYQNCNQWLAELLATAWGGLRQEAEDKPNAADSPRAAAQDWLQAQGYAPTVLRIDWQPLMWLAARLRWLHSDDHPAQDLDAAQFRVSMPQGIENFVQQRYPEATRIELCYTTHHVVVHRGWGAIAAGCVPSAGDEVTALR